MILTLVIILGLTAGSFLTSFIDRLHDGRNFVTARSTCDSCGHKLGILDLVPLLSWLLSRGKCRHCHQVVSWRYPVIELVTVISFVCSYLFWPFDLLNFQDWVYYGLWLVTLTFLIGLSIYDLRWFLLPNKLVFLVGGLAIILLGWRLLLGHEIAIWDVVGGIAVGGGIFYIILMISDKYIGGGDVKLGFVLGLLLSDWLLAAMMLFVASLLGVVLSLPFLIVKRKGKSIKGLQVPFGPFLIFASLLLFWFGESLKDWYL